MRISDWSSDVCSSDLEVVLVELLAGLVDGVKSDQRILELGRRLAHDRLAVAIDAIDVVSADILRCIGHRAAGCREAVDTLLNLAGAIPLPVETSGAHQGAASVLFPPTDIVFQGEEV